ncbi:MAG: restriction endonuclease subunit S [Bacteroides sp.]|nr:restriction endonuclease subunit S [Bacteroides sp.]
MAQDKDHKNLNVPPLRFPGFTDEWKKNTLGDIVQVVKAKISTSELQSDSYISTENILPNFAGVNENYNIPDSQNVTKYKAGDILLANIRPYLKKIWLADRSGGCNADVLVFRPNINSSFVYYAIANDKFCNYVMSGAKGIKMPRGDKEQILKFEIGIASKKEQQKIVSLLSIIDERIATQNKIIDNLQSLIKGLIQHLICVGLDKGTWHNYRLSEVLQERNEMNKEYYPVHSVSVSVGIVNQVEYLGRSFAAKDTVHYHVVRYGDIVYTKSPTGNQPYGIIKQSFCQNPVAVSPLYGVYDPISFEIGNILHYYFLNPLNTNNYLLPLIQKGAKNTINITNHRFLENSIPLPISNEEITSVSKTLSSLNSKIELENRALNTLLKERQYLLNMLFI